MKIRRLAKDSEEKPAQSKISRRKVAILTAVLTGATGLAMGYWLPVNGMKKAEALVEGIRSCTTQTCADERKNQAKEAGYLTMEGLEKIARTDNYAKNRASAIVLINEQDKDRAEKLSRELVPVLFELAAEAGRKKDWEFSRECKDAISSLGHIAAPSILEALKSNDASIVETAIGFAAKSGLKEAAPILVRLMGAKEADYSKSPEEARYFDAERALETLVASYQDIGEAVRDERPEIRRIAASVMVGRGGRQASDELIQLLVHDKDPQVRERAVSLIEDKGGRQARDELVQFLKDKDSGVRLSAAGAFEEIGDVRRIGVLKAALNEEKDSLVKDFIADAIQTLEIIKKSSVADLTSKIERDEFYLCGGAKPPEGCFILFVLGRIGDQSAGPALERALERHFLVEQDERISIVATLGELGYSKALPTVRRLYCEFGEDNETVQRTIGRLGGSAECPAKKPVVKTDYCDLDRRSRLSTEAVLEQHFVNEINFEVKKDKKALVEVVKKTEKMHCYFEREMELPAFERLLYYGALASNYRYAALLARELGVPEQAKYDKRSREFAEKGDALVKALGQEKMHYIMERGMRKMWRTNVPIAFANLGSNMDREMIRVAETSKSTEVLAPLFAKHSTRAEAIRIIGSLNEEEQYDLLGGLLDLNLGTVHESDDFSRKCLEYRKLHQKVEGISFDQAHYSKLKAALAAAPLSAGIKGRYMSDHLKYLGHGFDPIFGGFSPDAQKRKTEIECLRGIVEGCRADNRCRKLIPEFEALIRDPQITQWK